LLNSAVNSLESLETSIEAESVLNARGYSPLLEHAASAIRAASTAVLIALWPEEAKMLESDLADAEARKVAVTILCMYACARDCGHCGGKAYRYRVAPLQRARWLIVVADAETIVAGEIAGDDAQAIITHQRLVVELAAAYIRHSIALAAIVEDLGTRLDESLKPRTRAVLNALSPQGENGSFIDYMRRLMSAEPSS
jgi:sugar-specific transcriptional regulator TrmB